MYGAWELHEKTFIHPTVIPSHSGPLEQWREMLEQVQYDLMSLAQLKKLAEEQQKLLNEKQNNLREKENQLKILYKKYQDQVDAENRLRKTKVALKQQEERLRNLRELRGLAEHEKNRSGVLSTELDSVKLMLQSKKDELRKVSDKVQILSQQFGRFLQQKEEVKVLRSARPITYEQQVVSSANYEFPPWVEDGTEVSRSIAAKQRQLQEIRAHINDVNDRLFRTTDQHSNKTRIPARENGHVAGDGPRPNGVLQRVTSVESDKALPNGTATSHAKSALRPVSKLAPVEKSAAHASAAQNLRILPNASDKPGTQPGGISKPNGTIQQGSPSSSKTTLDLPAAPGDPQVDENDAAKIKLVSEMPKQPVYPIGSDIGDPQPVVDAATVHVDNARFSYAANNEDEIDQCLPAKHIPVLSTSPSINSSHRSSLTSRGQTPVKINTAEKRQSGEPSVISDNEPATTISSSASTAAEASAPPSSNTSSTVHGGDEADNEEATKADDEQEMTPSKLIRRVSFDPLALLLDAALEGELELVRKVVEQVADASAPNDEGITALHNAICTGHYDVVKFLVEFGCDVNVQDADGWSPLHCAASCTHAEMLKLLVEHGACVFATTFTDNETPSQKCEEGEDGYEVAFKYLSEIEATLGYANDAVVYAAYDFEAHNNDELSFRCGDRIRVLHRDGSKAEREWWWAKVELASQDGNVRR